MNKDQIEGAVKSAAGNVQKQVGKITGSEEQQVKGAINIAKGKTPIARQHEPRFTASQVKQPSRPNGPKFA